MRRSGNLLGDGPVEGRAQVDPEAALRATAARFRDRFRNAEAAAAAQGVDIAEVWEG